MSEVDDLSPQVKFLIRKVQQWSGKFRMEAIAELNGLGYSLKKIERLAGFSDNYLSTWKYRYQQNKDTAEMISSNQSNQNLINNSNQSNHVCSELIDKIDYDYLIDGLRENKDQLPYAQMILDRTEGKVKRDRSMVRAVLSCLKQLIENDVDQEELN